MEQYLLKHFKVLGNLFFWVEFSNVQRNLRTRRILKRVLGIRGHGGGLQEGGRKWAGRGGDLDFSCRGGGKHFLLQEGGRVPKNCKKAPKNEVILEICSK